MTSPPSCAPAAADHAQVSRRVGEDVATLTPHRSGRAELPLPVLHGRASLTDVVADTIPDSPVKKVAGGVKRHPSFRSCQFSYPLSFRGQVCETQSSLLCCPSTVLSTWHPSFLDRVPVSPVPRCHRSYCTTSRHACPVAYLFRFRGPRYPPRFVSRSLRLRSQRVGGDLPGRGHVQPATRLPPVFIRVQLEML
jgi:hypothetical protein